MRFFPRLAIVSIALNFAVAAPAAAQQSQPAPASALAPADESFGHFKLSVLGIANTIRLGASRLGGGADPHSVCEGSLAFASDAIAEWERAYPRDPAIPRDLLALERAYLAAPSAEARAHAVATETWLTRDYPDSEAARTAQAELSEAQASR